MTTQPLHPALYTGLLLLVVALALWRGRYLRREHDGRNPAAPTATETGTPPTPAPVAQPEADTRQSCAACGWGVEAGTCQNCGWSAAPGNAQELRVLGFPPAPTACPHCAANFETRSGTWTSRGDHWTHHCPVSTAAAATAAGKTVALVLAALGILGGGAGVAHMAVIILAGGH